MGVLSALLMPRHGKRKSNTYEITPYVIFASGLMVLPFSSTAGSMVNACRMEATMRNNEASAKWRPGQILGVRERVYT